MRMIKMLAEKDGRTPKSTLLTLVSGCPTHKTMTCVEEQVCIHVRQLGEHIKCEAVHSHQTTSREG
jgi:hypothetical protein